MFLILHIINTGSPILVNMNTIVECYPIANGTQLIPIKTGWGGDIRVSETLDQIVEKLGKICNDIQG